MHYSMNFIVAGRSSDQCKKITGRMSEAHRRASGIVASDLGRKFVKYCARINALLARGITLV